MVRADMLDAIDRVLRRYRRNDKPFGGVQVLMIGDLYQLPPVVSREEQHLISSQYESPYFFSSKVYREARPLQVELKHIYRQQDSVFINILAEIRNGILSQKSRELLSKRYNPDFNPGEDDAYITLTTHNRKAEKINMGKLREIPGKSITYRAEIRGRFPEQAYPTPEELELKKGAQVMFVKNDSSFEKRYYNGKIGTIIALDEEEIIVQCEGEELIEVKPETWEQISYEIDPLSKEIREKRTGSFTQYPLKLAWAITIHKSQGLTFDKVMIDAADSFSHGQTYVALSRCRSLEGIVLTSPIDSESIITDKRVASFTVLSDYTPTGEELFRYKKEYQLNLISEIFDYYPFIPILKRLLDIYYKNAGPLTGNISETVKKLQEHLLPLIKISRSFDTQLRKISGNILPEQDTHLQERFIKAISYYHSILEEKLLPVFEDMEYNTDNKQLDKDVEEQINILNSLFKVKKNLLTELKEGFHVDKMLSARARGILDSIKPPKKKELKPKENAELFEELKMLRQILAQSVGVHPNLVFQPESLYEMCRLLPVNIRQLRKINGMGKTRIQKYGEEIVEVIREYTDKYNLQPDEKLTGKTTPKVGSSHQATHALLKDGLSIKEIAEVRGLAESTIEGHLAQLIKAGKIRLKEVMKPERIEKLDAAIGSQPLHTSLKKLKEIAGEAYGFNELRMYINQRIFDEHN